MPELKRQVKKEVRKRAEGGRERKDKGKIRGYVSQAKGCKSHVYFLSPQTEVGAFQSWKLRSAKWSGIY